MLQLYTNAVIFLIILSINLEVCKARNAKFLKASYRANPKYFSKFNISVQNGSIFADLDVVKTLEVGFKANVECQIRLSNSKKYQTLFTYTLDICNVVVAFKETIFKKWFKSLLKYGNFMQNCTVHKGHYYLNGWKLDSSLIPSYLYPGDYRIKGAGFSGKVKEKDEFIMELSIDTQITAD